MGPAKEESDVVRVRTELFCNNKLLELQLAAHNFAHNPASPKEALECSSFEDTAKQLQVLQAL